MRIQVITERPELLSKSAKDIHFASYDRPQALDEFHVNVLDLAYSELWRCQSYKLNHIERNNDLIALTKMHENSDEAFLVLVFPQNEAFLYDFDEESNEYCEECTIKDLVNANDGHLAAVTCFPGGNAGPGIIFEPTKTLVTNRAINSDFHFIGHHWGNPLTVSDKSKKATTIRYHSNLFCTTLDICESAELIKDYIESIFEEEKPEIPSWVSDYIFGDDNNLKDAIKQYDEEICFYGEKKKAAQDKLEENNRFKSILVENGNKLVEVVFEMLDKMLDCDLASFVDEKEADFIIEKGNVVFVGEIKGITSNVKNEFISQLEVNYHKYLDKNSDSNSIKKICQILIINPFRNKDIAERESVHKAQIDLAKRNGSLIVETKTFLKMFEEYQKGKLSSTDCIDILSNKTGLLTVADLTNKHIDNTEN